MSRCVAAVVLLVLVQLPACGQAPEPDFAKLERVVAEEMKEGGIPGAAVAVVRGDKVLFAKGFGVRSIEFDDPVTADTVFRIASVSKMFTAAVVVQLAEEGKLDLHTPVGKYLKDLPPVLRDVTTHQLLTHTAGLFDMAPGGVKPDDAELGRAIRRVGDQYRIAPAGSTFSYSNLGYDLAGLLVEELDGKPYVDAMSARLFGPLGMKRTGLRPTDAVTHPFAVEHRHGPGKKPAVIRPLLDTALRPSGMVHSTVLDLARWSVAVLNGGKLDGKQVLSPTLIEKLSTAYVEVPDLSSRYGYGLICTTVRGVRVAEHGGTLAGYRSLIRFAPEQKVAVIALANGPARLPKSVESACELVLPLGPKPGPEESGGPLTEEEGVKLAGRYKANFRSVTVSRTDDGKLKISGAVSGIPPGTYERLDGWRFKSHDEWPIVFVPGEDGRAGYLHHHLRALARVESPTAGAKTATPDFAKLEKVVAEEMKEANIPGVAIAVVRGDQVLFAKGFGVRSVDCDDPVTADTLFRLGSTSKMFTAAAVVQLAEEGKIRLDEPVGKHVPGLPAVARDLTPHQLLTHTAGLTDESPMSGKQDDEALGRGVRAWDEKWRFTEPGRVYSYSNPGYWLAGLLVEEVDGKPFADAMRARLFAPLGMRRTCLRPTEAMTWPLAVGHEVRSGKPAVVRPLADNAATRPAGQVCASANDLARFAVAFLNGGKLDGKQALSPSLIETLGTGYVEVPGQAARYGYGLNSTTVRGVRVVEHGGSRTGYGSLVRFAPEQKVAVVLLTSKTGGQLPRTVETACELVLPLGPKPEAKKPDGKPLTEVEATKFVGRYTNNRQTVTVSRGDDGKLRVTGLTVGGTYERVEGWRFASGGREVVFVPGADGSAAYLHAGGRSLARAAGK